MVGCESEEKGEELIIVQMLNVKVKRSITGLYAMRKAICMCNEISQLGLVCVYITSRGYYAITSNQSQKPLLERQFHRTVIFDIVEK